jgi:cytoskeletal protein CcmA (bactofilin family)
MGVAYDRWGGGNVRRNQDLPVPPLLGEESEFEGKLFFTGAARLDGRMRGEIRSDGVLIVGESGVLHSEIRVRKVIVCGQVRGTIVASEKIEIRAPGKVFGNLQCPVVSVEDGVIFEGTCRMPKRLGENPKKLRIP